MEGLLKFQTEAQQHYAIPEPEIVMVDKDGNIMDKDGNIIKNDPVNHPSHYTTGKIEVIDFIQDKGLDFCRGNAIKYIVRAGLKDPNKEIEDLKKAIWYINAEIKNIEKKN